MVVVCDRRSKCQTHNRSEYNECGLHDDWLLLEERRNEERARMSDSIVGYKGRKRKTDEK